MTRKATATVADAFGPEVADQLARWAIDAIVDPPARLDRPTTRLSSSRVRRGREILEAAGVDWRGIKGTRHSGIYARRMASA